ncbi:MAG: threonylcarbamoyl-AMP synthase [Nitrospirae bacterium GWF2_44_13]|nr:MAG: threonylcarbamoyl-AMP synthase [Nitrospirae bacterium GWF2_44_13]OGW64135.1 MAG: threonylcarbamoyl-AMP synthase [Nitrospirae bacterium RIFOXYA2_FULL_44_9]HBG92613.1 threonylcarbamoyl-AMP synthase [Nitrospiraceae bacterium]
MLIKINEKNLSDVIEMAVEILNNGGIVAYPTETFYGLGVRFDKEASLRKLYELKKRPEEKPMPLIIGDRTLLSMIAASVNEIAETLMDKFWPGPLTLLLKAKSDLSSYLTARTGRVAVRIPGESFALHLAREAGFPITATSANPSGMPPAEDADAVIRYFGKEIDMVIDGGKTAGGLPSTIADVREEKIKIVREGVIKRHLLEI